MKYDAKNGLHFQRLKDGGYEGYAAIYTNNSLGDVIVMCPTKKQLESRCLSFWLEHTPRMAKWATLTRSKRAK